MPYLSIIVPTMRVGGLDFLFDSLAKQTFTDFELVLVDALFERRNKLAVSEARDRFISLRHVGLNPTPNFCAFSTFSNAGIKSSTGEILLFMVDYSRLPPDLLEKHARFHRADTTNRRGMMGPHRYVQFAPKAEFGRFARHEIDRYDANVASGTLDQFMWSAGAAVDRPSDPHLADGGAIVQADADPKLRLPPGPIAPDFYHAKNESVHRLRVVDVNGYDPDLDGAHLYQDTDFADRLTVKAGVDWTLDPTAIVDIVNPRHVFPFARRKREHESNRAIWTEKKAKGYPMNWPLLHIGTMREVPAPIADDPSVGRISPAVSPATGPGVAAPAYATPAPVGKRRIVMVYGEFSSHGHGPYDIEGLYERTGLTGSESSFFNLARTLAERGHEVGVFCDVAKPVRHDSGFHAIPIGRVATMAKLQGVHDTIAWNEPDYLRFAPPGSKRLCDQQLNDFGYCRDPEWQRLVDQWVSPSEDHRKNVMATLGTAPCVVIPNSVDLDLIFGHPPVRNPTRVVWCSSPDRGLHHLLNFWPEIRKKEPTATLRVFYRLAPWLEHFAQVDDELGRRARFITVALHRLAPLGVEVLDLVPNKRMMDELRGAAVLAYPCDPVRYTEGFGCSVLDATAAGCVPVISHADALPSVHGSAAIVVNRPMDDRAAWADAIVNAMRSGARMSDAMDQHAERHSRERITDQWEALLAAV